MKNSYVLAAVSSLAFACAAQPASEDQAPPESSPGMQQMRGHMEDMRALMEGIHDTNDEQERQRLMREHMQSMQRGMAMMAEMMRGQGAAPAETPTCAQGDTACQMQRMRQQHQMMNQRMSMMQMMMEQMMGQMTQRGAEEPATPPDDENHEAHH